MPIHFIIPPAIRANRFRTRHSPDAAAEYLNIPVDWIWSGIALRKLKRTIYLGRVYVKLESVLDLLRNHAQEVFIASGVPLTTPDQLVAVRGLMGRFNPDLATPDALAAAEGPYGRA